MKKVPDKRLEKGVVSPFPLFPAGGGSIHVSSPSFLSVIGCGLWGILWNGCCFDPLVSHSIGAPLGVVSGLVCAAVGECGEN